MTAHRLQGATVDCTYVLGSDELYREWGYTALSRHRDAARFYTLADHAQPPLPGLSEHEPVSRDVVTQLSERRSKQVALSLRAPAVHAPTDAVRELLDSLPSDARQLTTRQRELEHAAREFAAAAQLARATERRITATPAFRRSQRRELNDLLAAQRAALKYWEREHEHRQQLVEHARQRRDRWLAEHEWELRAIDPAPPDRLPGEALLERALSRQRVDPELAGPSTEAPAGRDLFDR